MKSLIFTLFEALAMCLIYTVYLAVKIRKNAVPLVFLYPQEIQDISIKRGDITVEHIKKNRKKFVIFSYVILISMMIISVFIVNKSRDFFSIWWQVVIFIEFFNLYDAFIIDAFWVRKTKAWQIPGAEGMDYIPYGSKTKKRVAVAILALPIAALIAGIAMLVI